MELITNEQQSEPGQRKGGSDCPIPRTYLVKGENQLLKLNMYAQKDMQKKKKNKYFLKKENMVEYGSVEM